MTSWYEENLLKGTVKKYQSMVLGKRISTDGMDLRIVGVQIEQYQNMKLLGEDIDSELNFSNHVSELCRKTSQQIGELRRLKNFLPAHAKLQLFKAAILPHLTYCGAAWHFCRASDRRKVERLALKRIVFNSKLDS